MGNVPRNSADDSADSLVRWAADILEPSSIGVPTLLGLVPGVVLADRFVVDRRAGSGGMGVVYRAMDRLTREAVALKVMASGRTADADRFEQEAVVLAELSHPSIVRYVAHGTASEATQFLAMEWLEGEDLAERLARASLTVDESLLLVRRACEGVAKAHLRGIVHRDIKPSNLFLAGCDPASVKVLDFGIARQSDGARALTQSGAMLGTVGYMSPEQAMASRAVDARADVFALGCVLFECLTGRAAFVGPNAVAVLAKVLREDPPRVSELRPGLGGALDILVARLLAKNPDERPKDAAALLRALDEIGQTEDSAPPASRPSMGLSATEQKIVSVILCRPRKGHAPLTEPTDGDMRSIETLTRRFGAEPVALRGGGLLVVLSGGGAATNQASQAARCALLLGRLRPELCIAVATGRAETTGRIPVGAAIDRTAELLARSDDSKAGIDIDDLTAGLLEPGFEVRRDGNQLVLTGERAALDATRLLMGKPTPFVGRDKELGLLDLTLRECIDESVARAVLVTGPPGQGKSRLGWELVTKARQRGDARVLIARADPVGAGSAFMLVRQIVRRAMGLREGNLRTQQQASLRAYVARLCKGSDAERIADFLGELVGLPSPERPSPELRAARDDPQIMSVWLRQSFGEWLEAECAAAPLLLVLEDLHWGDLPSVTYFGEALRALATKPLMVLALARPEVHEAFPNFWTGAEKQEIALGRLTPRAAERLVRGALGEQLTASAVARVVEHADGNAFYLEELIRRMAEGDSETLPQTVLAVVQSRLERLEPEARRILRAASIFGEVAWRGGVAALLRGKADTGDLDGQLLSLADNEVLVLSHDSRFAGEREYAFRHGLLREAAYAMLTDADRTAGHRLAGEWLEHAGEKDALTLADHFELGGQPKQAVPWLVQAAQQAADGGHMQAMTSLSERGVACGAEGAHRGALLGMLVGVLLGHGEPVVAVALGREAIELLPAGSSAWLFCAANLFSAGAYLGDPSITGPVLQAILSAPCEPEPSGNYGWAIWITCMGLMSIGALDLARSVLERAESMLKGNSSDNLLFVAGMRVARSFLHLVTGQLGSALVSLSDARTLADRVKHLTNQAVSRLLLIAAYAEVGSAGRAEASARELLALCEPNGLRFLADRTAAYLATARIDAHRVQDAIAALRPLIDRPDRQLAISARARLAHALFAAGDLDSAAREASAALEEGESFPSTMPTALGALSLVALHRSQLPDAVALADRGLDAGSRGIWPRDGSILRLVRAEALHGLGKSDDARAAIGEARDRILRIAATLADPELHESYMTDIAANARTLELANEWLQEDSP